MGVPPKRRFAAFALLVALAGPATAQDGLAIVDAAPVDPDNFNESFDASAAVSGAPLVGLRLDEVGEVTTNSVLVVGPPDRNTRVCLRVTTKDGRFFAANAYGLLADPDGGLVRISPLSQDYAAELGKYAPDQVAVRAFMGSEKGCTPAGAINLPTAEGVRRAASELVLLANGKSQPADVTLFADGSAEEASTGSCRSAPSGSNIAYDLICRMPLPEAIAGRVQIRLRFSDGFGSKDEYTYAVLLPAVTP